ncbi:MAG TPA: AAA family ATPase, partial [candidate division WWE3 bacterium]|nr:AAA family ATPase [candidate division WWE3 bacterium]
MFFKYLLYLTKEFPKFLFFRIPEHLVYFYKNSFSELEKRLQVRLNLGMFFVPLWGARDWALRFVSLLYRLFRIVFGSFILLVYTLLLASFAFLLFLSLPYFLFKSFPVFLALLLLYFVSYIGYFVLNPFKQLIFNEKDKTFEDLYSSSLLKARKFLESIQDNRDIDSYFSDIANYLELDYKELEKFISNVKDKEKEIVTRTLRLGTDLKYRYLSSDLLACAILYVQEDFIKYLDLKNLPADSLDVFLKIQYSKIPKNSPNLWDNDFVSNYVYPYDLSKQDKSTPILNKYANSLDVSKKSLEVYYVEPFIRYRNELIHNLDVGSKKVLIVGNAGVGKTSLVKTLYLDIKLGKVPKSLLYNRIVSLDLSSIVSLGLEGPKLLSAILQEFTSLKNTILFLDNLHVLYSVSGMDYLSILLPYFENPKLKIIVSADYSTYINLLKKDTGITNNFRVIKVEELEG